MEVNYAIETKGLSFQFGSRNVINNIDLRVPKNSIFGLLGPNGAGKSTTIRSILGLIQKKSNEVLIFGKSIANNRIETLTKVGALIDFPSFYNHLSARKNLEILARLTGQSNGQIEKTLRLVDLEYKSDQKVRSFSMGMKQRLGLAIALLNDPELLILDEPANGLDPQGIIDLRNLLLKLQKEHGKTILLSSHILDELEKVATHFAIIHKGSIRFQGSKSELTQTGSLEESFLKMTT